MCSIDTVGNFLLIDFPEEFPGKSGKQKKLKTTIPNVSSIC